MSAPAPNQPPLARDSELRNRRDDIQRAEQDLLAAAASLGYSERARFALRLALEEAIMNAFRHGNRGLPDDTPIRLAWSASPDAITIRVEDKGKGFDPDAVPDPTLDENLEMPTGRGITLMRAYMTDVRYELGGRRVVLHFDRAAQAAKAAPRR